MPPGHLAPILFAILLCFFAAVIQGQLSVQDPVTLDPKTATATISLVLNVPPTSTVKIEIESDCIQLSVCVVTFTPANWNIPQQVTVYLDARNKNFTCCPVSFTVKAICFPEVTKVIKVCRTIPSPPSCGHSNGDPHIYTLDGLRYDGFAVGDYHLVREISGHLSIQVRQSGLARASYNSAVVIKFGSYIFYAEAGNTLTPEVSAVGSAAENGVLVTQDGDVFTLVTPTEITVTIKATKFSKKDSYFLSIEVCAPPHLFGQLAGLLGLFDGTRSNDFTLEDGTKAPDGLSFNQGWEVKPLENLFLNANAIIPPIFGHPGPAPPSVGRYCKGRPTEPPGCLCFLDRCAKDSPVCKHPPPSGPPVPDCATAIANRPDLLVIAKQKCDALFNGPAAKCCKGKGVDPTHFYDSCVCDYVLTEGEEFCFDNLNAYLKICAAEGRKKGFSCKPCDCDCNGRGTCVGGSCLCHPPWKGPRCDEDWSQPPCITKVTPQGTASCDSKVVSLFVYGSGFFGGDLKCIINGQTVPATKVSHFQLVCPYPNLPRATTQLTVVVSANGVLSKPFSLTLKVTCCANPCVHGTCIDTPSGFTCNCTGTDYEGRLCDIRSYCPPSSNNGAFIGKIDNDKCSFYQCPPGQRLFVKRCCDDGKHGPPIFGCTPYAANCSAEHYCNAKWPLTYEGVPGFGICDEGFEGQPTRYCLDGGHWDSQCTNQCKRKYCVNVIDFNASWPDTLLQKEAKGTCLPGFVGSPTRRCESDGSFGPIYNPCVPKPCFCPQVTENGLTWPKTDIGKTTEIPCPKYHKGKRTRLCRPDGTFGPVVDTCVPVFCPSFTDSDGIYWPKTNPGEVAQGVCPDDCHGGPTRPCKPDGTFGPITGSCEPKFCRPVTEGGITWPKTDIGDKATAPCPPGKKGFLYRYCKPGGYFGPVVDYCHPIVCHSFTDNDGVYWPKTEARDTSQGRCPSDCDGGPTRPCGLDGNFGPVTGKCTRKLYCPAKDSWYGYDWPKTPAGHTVTQNCPRGTTGKVTRECGRNGEWKDIDYDCEKIFCEDKGDDDRYSWKKTPAGEKCEGYCKKGRGSPWRTCGWDGKMGPIQNPCRFDDDDDNDDRKGGRN